MQTAAPFAALEHMTPQILPGIDEIDPGIYGSSEDISIGTLTYELTTLLWAAGAELLQIPGSVDVNGVVFDQKFTDAVDTMYQTAMANPVVSANGQITDVAFNNEESIVVWMLMNVKNPDLGVLLDTLIKSLDTPTPSFLSDGGVVQ
ncbi:MAG: histidine phosphatase family protein, partial [Mycobacterium sp.]